MQTPTVPTPPPPPLPPMTGVVGPQLITPDAPLPVQGRSLAQLRSIRSELSDQLISASGRRDELSEQLQEALASGRTGAEVEGLQARIQQLDARILQLEGDIASTGREVAMVASEGGMTSSLGFADNPFGMNPGQMTGVSVVFIIFVLFPLAIAMARGIWRRASRPAPPPALPAESVQRLERLEQGMDAVAIEVERISEGQRFVTRLLTERAQPVAQRLAEAVPVRDGGRE